MNRLPRRTARFHPFLLQPALLLFFLTAALGAQDEQPPDPDWQTGQQDQTGKQEKQPAPKADQEAGQEPPSSDIRNAFLPGLSYSLLQPFETPALYHGMNFHYAFIQGITSAEGRNSFGGYYEWYSEIGFYKEQNSPFNEDIFFTYSGGVNLSFEKFLGNSRTALIPYFGAKVGGIYGNLAEESGMLIEPVLGMVIWNTGLFSLNYDASLFLNTVDLAGLIGIRHSAVLNLNL